MAPNTSVLAVLCLYFAATLAVELRIDVTCTEEDPCIDAFYINGEANPSIHCNLGDTVTFMVRTQNSPFYIKTKRTTGSGDKWAPIVNNGITSGTITLDCSREAKISPLYYQSGNSEKAGATICVGKPCGATLCTDKLCWGDEVAEKKPTAIAKYINTLASDFAWYFERLDYIESWNWESAWIEDWTLTKRGLSWYAKINYIRSAGVEASQNMVKNELSQIIGVPATWFEFVIKEEGGIGGTTIGELWVHDPAAFPEETEQKGFVDLLFFAGIAESLEEELFCRIHTTCLHSYKRFCYRYLEQNLIGEYSGNNHARENTCYANVDPEWGHTKVSINEDRTGGIFHMQCDEGCRFCKKEGTFVGDECICFVDESHPEPTGYPYYCISVKYASAFSLAPSIFLFLFNLWRFI